MFFKNLCVFQFDQRIPSTAKLEDALESRTFRPCSSHEVQSDGWVSPLGRKSASLVHEVNGAVTFCLQIEEKVLPNAVIKELLVDRIEEIESRERRPVARREKSQLRDELIVELVPRAFTKCRRIYAYIDRPNGWLLIDSSSPKGVEELTSRLRESLGRLVLRLPLAEQSPSAVMSAWVDGEPVPESLQLADECELRDGEGVIRCKGQDLASDEIAKHIEAGKLVTRLSVEWNARISVILADDLIFRRLRLLDVVLDELVDSETEEERFDTEFALMSGELREFLPSAFGFFGGLAAARD